jgi:Mg-chelatase subunit ChlD
VVPLKCSTFLVSASSLALLVWAAPSVAQGTLGPDDLVVVTEDLAVTLDGCDAVSVFSSDTGQAVFRGERHTSPGRLTATSDLRVVLASPSNGAWWNNEPHTDRFDEFLYLAFGDAMLARWRSGIVLGVGVATFGGIAVLPGDQEFLVATSAKGEIETGRVVLPNRAPFFVKKYALPPRVVPEQVVGPALGLVKVDAVVVEILVAPDGRVAHLLTDNASVYTLDFDAMQLVDAPIRLAPFVAARPNWYFGAAIDRMHATLSADGRYLIANRGESSEVSVADLVKRTSWTLVTSPDFESIGGVASNWSHRNGGLLALHAAETVAVYRWVPHGPLVELGRAGIARPYDDKTLVFDSAGPKNTIAWSGDGGALIAATGAGSAEFVMIEVASDGAVLRPGRTLEACPGGRNFPNDILTTNGLRPPESPTPTATLTPPVTLTDTPPATGTPTTTARAPSATHTPAATATATATPVPAPAYLPLALRERCIPGTQRLDVALVIDASTSMRTGRTATGRTKLAAAIEAAHAFVDTLVFPQDQAAVIVFNDDAWVVQELTGRQADILVQLAAVPGLVHQQTRIDRGIEEGHRELTSTRRRVGNRPVMIVLTDGLANPMPASVAVERAKAAKDDGITVFAIGLGRPSELNVVDLAQMASRPEYFYRAPDGEDLVAIYRTIAIEIPCPARQYWGRR